MKRRVSLCLTLLPALWVGVGTSQATETNAIRQTAAVGTNAVATQSTTSGGERLQVNGSRTLPRLQPRKRPDLASPRVPSPAQQAELQRRQLTRPGMPPNRLAPGATNGPAGLDPRSSRSGQYEIRSRRAPPAVLERYDHDKNGLLDPAEWYLYRQEVEQAT